MSETLSCWILSDGRRGIENQALGLAEAINRLRPLNISTKLLSPGTAFKALQPGMQFSLKSSPQDYGLKSPFPHIAIGCGRQAIAALRALKKQLGSDVFTVYVQDPRVSPKHFDLVVAPEHDGLKGDNVIATIGSPNRVTNERLITETLKFGDKLARLPAPRVAMLIGGKSKSHDLDQATHDGHMTTARTLLANDISLLVTTSRRTPAFAADDYIDLAKTRNNAWVWDGVGDNPYFAYLGSADAILVTEDSTNMLTEACATGKPVFTLPMKGKAGKFAKLYDALQERCNLAPYANDLDAPDYAPLDETERAAKAVLDAYDSR